MGVRHARMVATLLAVLLAAACQQTEFPVAPTPLAHTPVTTTQGSKYEGYIVPPSGDVVPYNMTLIARGLGATAVVASQDVGTTVVTGYFTTGTGLSGTVEGQLAGTLEGGSVTLALETVATGCTERRTFSGLVTGTGVALAPGAYEQSCPTNVLNFTVHSTRSTGTTCSITITPASASFTAPGGAGTLTVSAPAECPWAVSATAPFVTVEGAATRTGSGVVRYQVAPNDGPARSAAVRIADRTHAVAQAPPPTGTLRGRVTDARTGAGIPNVELYIHSQQTTVVVSTSATGEYTTSPLPAGTWNVDMEVFCYEGQSAVVTIRPGEVTTYSPALVEMPPQDCF